MFTVHDGQAKRRRANPPDSGTIAGIAAGDQINRREVLR